jgi:hypothetical protein
MKILGTKKNKATGEVSAEILVAGSVERGGIKIEITRDQAIKQWKAMEKNPEDYSGQHFNVNKMKDVLADATEKITKKNIKDLQSGK